MQDKRNKNGFSISDLTTFMHLLICDYFIVYFLNFKENNTRAANTGITMYQHVKCISQLKIFDRGSLIHPIIPKYIKADYLFFSLISSAAAKHFPLTF